MCNFLALEKEKGRNERKQNKNRALESRIYIQIDGTNEKWENALLAFSTHTHTKNFQKYNNYENWSIFFSTENKWHSEYSLMQCCCWCWWTFFKWIWKISFSSNLHPTSMTDNAMFTWEISSEYSGYLLFQC